MIRGQVVYKVLISLSLFALFNAPLLALTDAQARDQVDRLYRRIAGVPPTAQQMTALLPSMKSGDPTPTAFEAMREDNFYKSTLVRIFSPFSNVEARIDESGNDFNATIVGLVRDDEDFRQAISGDALYTADDASMTYDVMITPPVNNGVTNGDGNFTNTIDRCPFNIRTRARPANAVDRVPADLTWQRAMGDPGYDTRYDPYTISINNRGTRPAIQEEIALDEFGASRTVPAMAAENAPAPFPASRFPLFTGQQYGNNNSPTPNLSWSVCHRWPGFRNDPPAGKVRALGSEDNVNSFSYRSENNSVSHYMDLVKLPNWPQLLTKRVQSDFYSALTGEQSGTNGGASEWNKDIAGVMTTLIGGKAYFLAGTNRRAISLTFLNWLGYSMEQLHDPNVSVQYVAQDLIPEEKCAGCHAGKLDPMRNATNRLDYNDNRMKLLFNFGGNLDDKLFRGCANPNNPASCVRPSGFNPRLLNVNEQNRWWNLVTVGRNSFLGWRVPPGMNSMTEGVGFNSLMKVFANTEAFSNRMIDLATKAICLRNQTPAELDESQIKARAFEAGISDYADENADNPYNLRAAFAEAAKACFGRVEN